tara:strand:- start:1539 stop:2072 length:534 start_codon:yes stop_codon:yes gene_type:complete
MEFMVVPVVIGLLLGWFHQRSWVRWISIGLGGLLGLVLGWSVISLIDQAVVIIMAEHPGITRQDLSLLGIIIPGLTLIGFGLTRWARMQVQSRGMDRLDRLVLDDLVRQIDQVAQDDRFHQHPWVQTRWSRMNPRDRYQWVQTHRHQLQRLHLQAGRLGLIRLGMHGINQIDQFDRR